MKGWARIKTVDVVKVYLKQIEDREPTIQLKVNLHNIPNDDRKILRLKMLKEELKKALNKVEDFYLQELKKEVNSNGKH